MADPIDPIGGRRRVYTQFERDQIDPFKQEYMAATTPAQRKAIAVADIFPKLFTYWSEQGLVFSKEEEHIRTNVSLYTCKLVNYSQIDLYRTY
jgi:hypothetical protein